ncbi:hypothetical protein ACOMHN_005774 [Nucella lapillus]
MDSEGMANSKPDPSHKAPHRPRHWRTMSTPADAGPGSADGDDPALNDIAESLENSVISDSKPAADVDSRQLARKVNRTRKTRSLYGVSPHCKFGPKGFLLDCTSAFL